MDQLQAQLQALTNQLQVMDLQDLDPQLQLHIQTLSDAAASTQNHLAQAITSPTVSRQPTSILHAETAAPPDPAVIAPQNSTTPTVTNPQPPSFPWVPVDLSGVKPSESAFGTTTNVRQFGMPHTGVLPLEPPLHLFCWPAEAMSTLGRPDLDRLEPPPAVSPRAGYYPQAPTYTLNTVLDRSYRRGWRYAAPFLTSNRAIERDRMLKIQVPPNTRPARFDVRTQTFCSDPIPGMVEIPIGIPMVHLVNNDPKRAVTAVCAHTLDSLMQYEEGKKVEALMPRLLELTWGVTETESRPGVPAIFELDGMQTNLRFKSVDPTKVIPGDGSFNLASTHGEGEGPGFFMPAVQTNTPQAAAIIKEVLQILHQLYRYIMPLCLTRLEWEMIEFNGYENNVIAFGGLEPGPTSCQLNSSAAANVIQIDISQLASNEVLTLGEVLTAQLQSSIGPQGANHLDPKDHPIPLTFFVLMFRLAPGSDLGPFIWNRGGLYVRSQDVYILFTAFRGQDIHSGYPPTYVKAIQDAWVSMDTADMLIKRFGAQVRCGYVLYHSKAATTHSTQILYSPSLHFLHSPAPNDRDAYRKYFCLHGDTILGDLRARANRLGLEGIYCLKNYFNLCRLKLGLDINTLLENTTYVDEEGNTRSLEPSLLDIENDEAYENICLYRRFYFWWRNVIADYSLGLTKLEFKEQQKKIRLILEGQIQTPKIPPTQHDLLLRPRQLAPDTGVIPDIEKIIARELRGAEAFWTLILKGSTEPQQYSERKTPWINVGANQQKCLEFLTNTVIPAGEINAPSQSGPGAMVVDAENADTATTEVDAGIVGGRAAPASCLLDSNASETTESPISLRGKPMGERGKRKRHGAESESSDSDDSRESYVVEAIIDSRYLNGEPEWRVRWEGYGEDQDFWLNETALTGAKQLLDQFNDEHGRPEPPDLSDSSISPSESSDDEYEHFPRKRPGRRSKAIARKLEKEMESNRNRPLGADEFNNGFWSPASKALAAASARYSLRTMLFFAVLQMALPLLPWHPGFQPTKLMAPSLDFKL
ncbi:hypothetical protein GGX14DRAFT_662664 [Mycena pura]|uniref:Chromo domain-containing protein n=1 Tax=Mycena pura TaxID=153505 RepID=A0AAD6YIB0_9AGAR|nr:hypothetical protein GGX14DRAFT_662664 [Mycena pura]